MSEKKPRSANIARWTFQKMQKYVHIVERNKKAEY